MRQVVSLGICGLLALGLTTLLGGCYARGRDGGPVACAPCSSPCTPCPAACAPCAPRDVRYAPCPPTCQAPAPSPSSTARSTSSPAQLPAPRVVASTSEAPTPIVQPASTTAAARAASESRVASLEYGRPGFSVYVEDGRLWVFEEGSDELEAFLAKGEPAKRVTRIGVGPDDTTVMSSEGATIDAYLVATRYAVPGYSVEMKDGRLWVFRLDSEAYDAYTTHGEPAKRVTRIGQGPHDLTVIGPDGETLDGYVAVARYGRRGFATFLVDGRLWVFRVGSEELRHFREVGEPARRVTRVGSGPDERSIIAPDGETIDAYMTTWR